MQDRVIGLSTSTWRYARRPDPITTQLLARLTLHASERPRFGYRQLAPSRDMDVAELEVIWPLHRRHYLSPALAGEGLVMATDPDSADESS